MLHPLPSKPGTSAPTPLPPKSLLAPTDTSFPENAQAGPSRLAIPTLSISAGPTPEISTTECAICSSAPKYTCPGCQRRTCSLNCSKRHKDDFGCSGQRDATSFIPLVKVGQGSWADDYRWLEEGRRKVAKWGEGLPKDVLLEISQERALASNSRGGGGGHTRGGGVGRGGRRRAGFDKRVMGLGRELMKRGVRVEFMPEGMERRKKNQSSWNPKTQSLHLTIQLDFDSSVISPSEKNTAIIPRVLVASSTTNSSSPSSLPTLGSILPSHITLDIDQGKLVWVMRSTTFLSTTPMSQDSSVENNEVAGVSPCSAAYFPPLDPSKTVIDVLSGTNFIEFPTITIMSVSEWESKLDAGQVRIVPLLPIESPTTLPSKRKTEEGTRFDQQKRPREDAEVLTRTTADEVRAEADSGPGPGPGPAGGLGGLGLGLGDYESGSDEEENPLAE